MARFRFVVVVVLVVVMGCYLWVNLSYGAGGIVFPLPCGRLGDRANFLFAFTI